MNFEQAFNSANANVFLREFTYDDPLFQDEAGQERELCDGAILIDDLLIFYQLKERNPVHDTGDPDSEAKWFRNKIVKKAVDQLASSNRHLEEQASLPLANLHGQVIDLTKASPTTIHNIVIYACSKAMPTQQLTLKGRESKRVGFVHFLHAEDYAAISETLCTPYEISDYLSFRARAFAEASKANEVPEKALLGKYLSNTGIHATHADTQYVDRLIDEQNEFQISRLLRNYLDRVVFDGGGVQYHAILAQLAKLRRNMLKVFRQRFHWAMATCREDDLVRPSRFYFETTGCAYVVIPLPASDRDSWHKTIQLYAMLTKHDLRSETCIGITITPDPTSSEHYLVNWCYINSPWEPDAELDAILAHDDFFRDMNSVWAEKYSFQDR